MPRDDVLGRRGRAVGEDEEAGEGTRVVLHDLQSASLPTKGFFDCGWPRRGGLAVAQNDKSVDAAHKQKRDRSRALLFCTSDAADEPTPPRRWLSFSGKRLRLCPRPQKFRRR